MWGEDGDDFIAAGVNVEEAGLVGMTGDDILVANGNDELIGGKGNDVMSGGAGRDVFFTSWFEVAAGEMDRITSHDSLDRYAFESSMAASITYASVAAGAAIRVDTGRGTFFEMSVFGATVAELQAQTDYF